ncbi:hypothetical protein HMPREF0185_02145 [Brevundimonas diminuta 470-4]|nr:hypothetical protein HMPREF0185_02145 [Brevundimonas diminuta 470-4]
MVGRPIRIDLEPEQIDKMPHLLLQDHLASLDAPVGCFQRL